MRFKISRCTLWYVVAPQQHINVYVMQKLNWTNGLVFEIQCNSVNAPTQQQQKKTMNLIYSRVRTEW